MSSASAEYSMQKGYIDWLLNIPWYQKTEDTTDILKVEEIDEEVVRLAKEESEL